MLSSAVQFSEVEFIKVQCSAIEYINPSLLCSEIRCEIFLTNISTPIKQICSGGEWRKSGEWRKGRQRKLEEEEEEKSGEGK